MGAADTVIKITALSIAGACYVLMIFFSDHINAHYAKFVIYPIFSGFLVLYIAFGISVFLGRDQDVELNSVWALYGIAAYVGAGTVLISTFAYYNTTPGLLGVIAGALSYVMAGVLLVDVITLQNE